MTHDPLTWDNLFGADPNYVNMPSDYEQGQRDMLAKCIAAVEDLERLSAHADQDDPVAGYIVKDNGIVVYRSQALAALRALQEKP